MVMDQQAREQAFIAALTTEHFVLQSTASTTVSESGAKASSCVMALSSSLVAPWGSRSGPSGRSCRWWPQCCQRFLLGIFTVVRLMETGVQNLLCPRRIAHIHRYCRSPAAPGGRLLRPPLGSFGATTTSTRSSDPRGDPDPDRDRAGGRGGALGRLGDAGHPTATGLLTGLSGIAAMVAAINSIVGGAGVALLATKLLGPTQELLAVVLGVRAAIRIMAVSVAYQQSRYQVVVAPTVTSSVS
jgi:hypothetical protein